MGDTVPVAYAVGDGIAVIRIANPPVNALSASPSCDGGRRKAAALPRSPRRRRHERGGSQPAERPWRAAFPAAAGEEVALGCGLPKDGIRHWGTAKAKHIKQHEEFRS
jgi:hypothetical protein